MSDLELVSLSLTAEYMGLGGVCDLFRKLPKSLSDKIERSVYNGSRRKLGIHLDRLRLKLASCFKEFENFFSVDCMPLEVCILSRGSRSIICKEQGYGFLDKGYCASQKISYYGCMLFVRLVEFFRVLV